MANVSNQSQPSPEEGPPAGNTEGRMSWPRFLLYLLAGVLPFLLLSRFSSTPPAPDPIPPSVSVPPLDPEVASLLKTLTREVETRPKYHQAWGRLGMALEVHGFKAEAVTCYQQARHLQPKEPRWPYFLSRLWLVDSPSAALQALREAVERCGNDPDYPRLRLAQLLLERNQLREAESNFEALLVSHPEHALAHLGLARLAGLREDWNEANRHLSFCVTNPCTARSAYLLLASLQMRQGNARGAETARRVSDAQISICEWPDPFHTETLAFKLGLRDLVEQCQQWLAQNRLSEAEPIATRLIETYPQAAEGWLFRGRIALVQDRLTEADRDLSRHLDLEPSSVDGQQQMGVLRSRQNRTEEAVRHFAEAIRLKPDALEAHYNLGLVELRENRPREAMSAFHNAIRCQPVFIQAYLALAKAAEQSGEREEAVAILRQAMEVNPYELQVQEEWERLTARP